MTSTHTFTTGEQSYPIEFLTADGEVDIKAVNVAKVLEIPNIHMCTANFDSSEKVLHPTSTRTGIKNATFLTSDGLTALFGKSDKAIITEFKPWIRQKIKELRTEDRAIRDAALREREENLEKETQKQQAALEEQRKALAGQEDAIYGFKIDANDPLSTSWKLGKSGCVPSRLKQYLTSAPRGRMLKIAKCTNMGLAEKNMHAIMTGLGCHVKSECYDIPDPELLYSVMDLVRNMDMLTDATQDVNLSHIQHLNKQYATVFEVKGGLIRDRRDIFIPKAKTPVVRLDPETRLVLETFKSVSAAKETLPVGNAEDIRRAVEKDEILHGYRYREWRQETDPPLPRGISSNKTVWKRDAETYEIIERYASLKDAADSVDSHTWTMRKAIDTQSVEKGFLWTEKRSEKVELPERKVKRKASCVQVKCTDSKGQTIIYDSLIEAEHATGVLGATISGCKKRNDKRRSGDPPFYTRNKKWLFETVD